MAVFRVEKTKDFTIMANHHLKNKALSLKAKGLLSVMLSLPIDWDYTLRGLAHISKESIDAIREGVRELEAAGYIIRSRSRNEKGQLAGADYVIYEHPQPIAENPTQDSDTPPESSQGHSPQQSPTSVKPTLREPTLAKPALDFPTQEMPTLENPTQLNTKEINTYPEKTQRSNIHPSNPNQTRIDPIQMEHWRKEIRRRIDYYSLVEDTQESDKQLDEIVELMVEIQCAAKPTIRVAGNDYPAELVKERFAQLTDKHIGYVTSCLRQNKTLIRNIKQYLLAALFNAPATVEHFYTAEFNHFYLGPGAK